MLELLFDLAPTGMSWDDVARLIGVSRQAASDKAAEFPELLAKRAMAKNPEIRVQRRPAEPLPPGHPITWGLITAGTSLEGAAYSGPRWTWGTLTENTLVRGF
jgi:hypothetical protein